MALVANYGSDSDISNAEEDNQIDNESEITNEFTKDEGEVTEGPSSSLWSSLPSVSSISGKEGYVDESEDVTSIPLPKPWELQLKPLPKPKKKVGGKVKIFLPALNDEENDDKDEESKIRDKGGNMRRGNIGTGRRLLSKLPKPENSAGLTSTLPSLAPPSTVEGSRKEKKRSSNAFVPHSVSKRAKKSNNSADEDDDFKDTSFFSLESGSNMDYSSTTSKLPEVKATPDVTMPESSSSAFGPQLPSSSESASSYPEISSDLMSDSAALERLAGKHALRVSSDIEVREVRGSSLVSKPNEWINKALTEDADRPGPKCTIKGESRRKHQITYLAALAKENEHKLKQQWAQSAANRRAAGAKYGF